MSALSIQVPFPIFQDRDGQPLENGYIWIGTANLDPEGNPISVYFDAALTSQAAQPIRTINGFPSQNGGPARLYAASDYSIRVQDKNGSLVYSAPSATERYASADINYTAPINSPATRPINQKVGELISAADQGKSGGNTIANLVGITPTTDGVLYFAVAYRNTDTTPNIGRYYKFDASLAKTNHNGGTIISPTVPWNGAQNTLAAFLAGTGETSPSGNGCWVMVGVSDGILAEYFGADPSAPDNTLAIQAAINSLPIGGSLSGSGKTYTVTTLFQKSNTILSRFNFVTKAGSVDFVSPVTVDGVTAPKQNIYFQDININGNRINQLNVTSPGPEDGGRHGFRILGIVSNIHLERCSAIYCAGDGLELFSSTAAGATDSIFTFNGVYLKDCVFNWNRRHGMSADSLKRFYADTVDLKWNGLDLNTADPLSSGGRGSRAGGQLYGNGFDFEGYGLGTSVEEIHMTNITGLYNARGGGLFYDSLPNRPVGFVPRQKIWITDSYFDEGQDSSRSGEGLTFTSTIDSKALAYLYDSIYIRNVRIDGFLLARNVSNLEVNGEIITNTAANYVLLDHSDGIVISVTPRGTTKTIYADTSTYSFGRESIPTPAAPTLSYTSGPVGSLTGFSQTILENVRDRTFRYLLKAVWTGSAGVPVFAITPPGIAAIVSPPRVEVISQSNGLPILSYFDLTIASFRFQDPGTGALNLQIVVDIKV